MTNEAQNQTENKNGRSPDWVVKAPKGSRLERIGVAWDREDGGICMRLAGKQIIDEDIYIYPMIDNAE